MPHFCVPFNVASCILVCPVSAKKCNYLVILGKAKLVFKKVEHAAKVVQLSCINVFRAYYKYGQLSQK